MPPRAARMRSAGARISPQVRGAAIRLAEAGRIVIYRKGKPADPHDFRGVYRLGLPRSD